MNNGKKNNIQDIEFTTLQLAEILGITSRRIRQLAEKRVFNPKPGGIHNLKISVQSFLKYQIEKEHNSDNVLKKAKRRKAVAEAEIKTTEAHIKKIDLDTRIGKLLDRAKVISDWQKNLNVYKARTQGLSSKVIPLIMNLRSFNKIKEIIDLEINEILKELSKHDGV